MLRRRQQKGTQELERESRENGRRRRSARGRAVRRGPKRFTISMQKRLVALFLIVLVSFAFLAVRLLLIQRDNGRSYTMRVLSQQAYDNKTIPYKRGRISDAKGTVLADSQLVYNVIVDVRQILEKDEYLEPSLDAAEWLGIDRATLQAYMIEHPGSQYYIARRNLPYQERRAFDRKVEEGKAVEEAALKAMEEDSEKENKEEAEGTDETDGAAGENNGSGAVEVETEGAAGAAGAAETEGAAEEADGTAGAVARKTDSGDFELYYSNIKGIWFEDSYIRTYPCGTLAADVIGFTVGNNRGSFGLEEFYNDTLNGVAGRTYGYLDETLKMEQTTIQPTDGNNLVLTLDANIQGICEKYLREFNGKYKNKKHKGNGTNNAACIIMDVKTGGILAMASEPGFDLNDPYNIAAVEGMPKLDEKDEPTTNYLTAAEAGALSDMDRSRYLNALWTNYCIGRHFEPGSTAKPFTTAMGLETGKLKRTDKFECQGQLLVGDTWIRCAHLEGCGKLDVSGAIERSCNVSLMQEAEKIGAEIFCKYQNVFNFGLRTNVDLAGETRTNEYLYQPENMGDTDLATNSFGQNFEVTMIQMITGFCSLINGGNYLQPHVVDHITSAGGSIVKSVEPRILKKTVSEETSNMIREFCVQAVEGEHATGTKARPAGYRIGGKTGTAETLPRENGQYVVSFMGFAPAENPQISIYVVLDRVNTKKQDDASLACEISRKILTEVLPYMDIYMTEPITETERLELEKLGLSDTNDSSKSEAQDNDSVKQ